MSKNSSQKLRAIIFALAFFSAAFLGCGFMEQLAGYSQQWPAIRFCAGIYLISLAVIATIMGVFRVAENISRRRQTLALPPE